jgi:hypothetical protein
MYFRVKLNYWGRNHLYGILLNKLGTIIKMIISANDASNIKLIFTIESASLISSLRISLLVVTVFTQMIVKCGGVFKCFTNISFEMGFSCSFFNSDIHNINSMLINRFIKIPENQKCSLLTNWISRMINNTKI